VTTAGEFFFHQPSWKQKKESPNELCFSLDAAQKGKENGDLHSFLHKKGRIEKGARDREKFRRKKKNGALPLRSKQRGSEKKGRPLFDLQQNKGEGEEEKERAPNFL